jgi:hypothetical protein
MAAMGLTLSSQLTLVKQRSNILFQASQAGDLI